MNEHAATRLIEFHWQPELDLCDLPSAQAAQIQGHEVGLAPKNLYDAIERGNYME